MASGQTSNYGLNQWAAEDQVIRTEFNEDNAKIDALLAEIPTIVTGSYVGDGVGSRLITLEKTPKVVYVCHKSGKTFSSTGWFYFGGLALPGCPAQIEKQSIVSIEESGFCVYWGDYPQKVYSNQADEQFYYIALL